MNENTTSPISQRRERRRAVIITWASVVGVICLAGSFIAWMIDLDTQAHQQASLTHILARDVFSPLTMLLVFGLFCYRLGQFSRRPPDRT